MTRAELLRLTHLAPSLTVSEAIVARQEGIEAAERWLLASDRYDGIEAYNARVRAGDEEPPDSGTWFVLLASDD